MTVARTEATVHALALARIYSKVTTYGIIAAQVVTGLVLAGTLLFWLNSHAAYSALTGAAIGIVPSFYLARRVFSLSVEATPDQILRAFYVGEGLKIGLTVGLFVIALLMLDVAVVWVVGGYLATIIVYWFAILMPEPSWKK